MLGDYRLRGRLGSGGMGVVYLGFGPDQTAVAVKTLLPGAPDEARTRMRREADLLRTITSPRVAAFRAADTEADTPWLALEYVSGPSLAEVGVPLSDEQLRQLANGLAEGLAELHRAGIVHRDVKPDNIILTHSGPMLVDLGIAHSVDMTAMTHAGLVIGSPTWMAPEQLRGEPVNEATDVWAWGAVLAYAATGHPPFGNGPIEALAWRIQHDEPDLTDVPHWLYEPLAEALAKTPADRPSLSPRSAATPIVTSTAHLTRPAHHHPVTWSYTRASSSGTPHERRRRATPALVMAASAGLVIALAATAVILLNQQEAPIASNGTQTTATNPTTAVPSSTPTWPDPIAGHPVKVAAPGSSPPPFPDNVPNYSVADRWRSTIRVFSHEHKWTTLYQFPATMNGCGHQRFYVRWRALDQDATVDSTLVSYDGGVVLAEHAAGTAGWMSSHGCGQPAFRWKATTGTVTLTDIVVEVQRWEASV